MCLEIKHLQCGYKVICLFLTLHPFSFAIRRLHLADIKSWDLRGISSVQLLSHVWLFENPCQASLSIINSQNLLKFMSIKSVMSSNHLIFCCPFSWCLQSFPASESFPMSQFFPSGSQSIGVSASVFPMNIEDWFPLGWTGWIFLLSKGLSRVFSNTTIQKHSAFFIIQLSHPHVYLKNHSFN